MTKYKLVGGWIESVLSTSLWVDLKKYRYSRFNKFVSNYVKVPSGWYLSKKHLDEVKKVDDEFIRYLMRRTDNIIEEAMVFNGDIKEFFDFIMKYLHIWNVYTYLGFMDYKSRIKTDKKCLLQEEKVYLKKLHENFNKKLFDEYYNRYSFIGTNAFQGRPLTKKEAMERIRNYKENREKYNSIAIYRMRLLEVYSYFTFRYWKRLKKISGNNFNQCTYLEILKGEKCRKRKEWGLWIKDGRLCFMSKEEINNFEMDNLQKIGRNLKGMVAYKGKVKGRAIIVGDFKDLKKIRKGDIVVAFETTPEFVPYLNKAAGIIVERGGMLSHASIISREMKIPCIVGIENATRIIRNNDNIILDAYKGLVDKL